ncbi:MAG TPA: hypothetical protein VGO40_05120 [Longimicrobium sp.]|nr:hypothetical protein [Longimicrobium sp.]
MPPLNEGSVMDMPSLFPGVGAGMAKQILTQRDAAIVRVPEVQMVLGKIGRAETAPEGWRRVGNPPLERHKVRLRGLRLGHGLG